MRRNPNLWMIGGLTISLFVWLGCMTQSEAVVAQAPSMEMASEDTNLVAYEESIPGTAVSFEMIPIPAGTVQLNEESEPVELGPFWMSATEVTWDAYDIFAYRLDLTQEEQTLMYDAESRPSRPYSPPDYGYGHQGYAAICVTYHAAQKYAEWLSEKTGHTYRLPTEAEWMYASLAGDDPSTTLEEDELDAVAWYRANSEDKAQPVGAKQPNAFGLYDMLGNVQEWVTGADTKPVTCGGSWRDSPEKVQHQSRAKKSRSWNETDPQIPKSRWWLSDGFFVGFRLVRVPE